MKSPNNFPCSQCVFEVPRATLSTLKAQEDPRWRKTDGQTEWLFCCSNAKDNRSMVCRLLSETKVKGVGPGIDAQ